MLKATLLGGAVAYEQAVDGHRSGIEPVLLAAAVPARDGDAVLEGGTGAGAGLLCLLHRVGGATGIGVEADPASAAVARRNLAANGFDARARILESVLPALPADLPAVAHAFANPPWFPPDGTGSPDPRRRLARVLPEGALAGWAASLGGAVAHGGTLTLVVPARLHVAAATALARAGFGGLVLRPLWRRAGEDARLALVQGRKGGRGADRIAPGLALHEADGRFTAAAERILRHGAALA